MIPGLVSAIIPAYNQARYVAQAIDSVLDQTYANTEVIVVNDGSADETYDIVSRYGERVRQIVQPNGGLPAARNTGIREAQGEFLAFVDADDVWLPEKLESQVALLQHAPDVGLVFAGFYQTDERLRQIGMAGPATWSALEWRRFGGPVMASSRPASQRGYRVRRPLSVVLPSNQIGVLTVVVRSAWLEQVGVFDTSLRASEDWDLWIRLAARGCRFAFSATPLALYRLHTSNMSFDPGRMAEAAFAVLDRGFRGTPAPIQDRLLERTSYQWQHLLASIRFEAAGNEEGAFDHVRQAVLLGDQLTEPLDLVTRYVRHPVWPTAVTDLLAERRARRLLQAIATARVGVKAVGTTSLSKIEACAFLVAAKVAFKSSPGHAGQLLIRAFQADPALVWDGGIFRTVIDRLLLRLRRSSGQAMRWV